MSRRSLRARKAPAVPAILNSAMEELDIDNEGGGMEDVEVVSEDSNPATPPGPSARRRKRGRGKGRKSTIDENIEELGDGNEGEEGTSPKVAGGGRGQKIKERSGVTLTDDEMIHNLVYYVLAHQWKKLPLKRADIIKNCMNGQRKDFNGVLEKFRKTLDDVFGMEILGLEKAGKTNTYTSFIVRSKYYADFAEAHGNRKLETDTKRSILFLLLSVMLMQNRSIDEETVWKIISEMKFHEILDKKRDDLQRFLKSEYVMPMYMNVEEIKDTEHVIVRYSWGPRAELEFCKFKMLQFATQFFPGKQPQDFTIPFNLVMQTERELVEAEMAKEGDQNPDGRNGSALEIQKWKGTATIDGTSVARNGSRTDHEDDDDEVEEAEVEEVEGEDPQEDDSS